MKKVVITGVTGFVGSAVAKKLLQQGVVVVGVDVDKMALEEMRSYGEFIPVVADFSCYKKLEQLIPKDNYDVFYHFAWQGVFGEAFKDYGMQLEDVKSACDALLKAKEIGCKKFVLAGTMNQYEVVTRIKDSVANPRWTCIYSTAKLAADMMCKTIAYNNDIEYNAGLIAMIFGAGNKAKTIPNVVIDCFLNGARPKLALAETPYDMIYIDDVAEAFVMIGESGKNQCSYYVGHKIPCTFGESVSAMRDVLAPDMKLVFGEYPDTMIMDFSLLDREALYCDTGFECKADFNESILKTAEWVKIMGGNSMSNNNSNMAKNGNGGHISY